MSRKRYTPEQIIGMLREIEVAVSGGRTVVGSCRLVLLGAGLLVSA